MARWPDQPFVLNDIIAIGYAEDVAGLAGLEDAQRRKETHAITAKAAALMARTTIQRYVEGDGLFLQEGRIHTVYETAAGPPLRPQVWRATPMDHPAPAGPQTTDDWFIIWQPHRPVRSSPLLRESSFVSRVLPLADLFVHEPENVFSAQDLLQRLYPGMVAQAVRSAPSEPAAHRRTLELANAMVRAVLYNQKASELLRAQLLEQGLQILQGHVVSRLEAYDRKQEGLDRTLFRAAHISQPVPEQPVRHGNSLVQWHKLHEDAPPSGPHHR